MAFSKVDISPQLRIAMKQSITDERNYHPQALGRQWAIVLAGGRGERMRAAIKEWMGSERPKQFCRFAGDQTMLEHTWHRARQIVSEQHIITVSVADQAAYFDDIAIDTIPGTLLYQPDNNGTAAAIYLALAHILLLDPEASVIVMPSDHFIFPESRFTTLATQALGYTAQTPEHLILLGAEARWPNPDYGWIEAEASRPELELVHDGTLLAVSAFCEKPDNQQARYLFSQSALWSTMIVAAKGKLLWQLAKVLHPQFFLCFLHMRSLFRELLHGTLPLQSAEKAMRNTFQHMPELDFSRDLLQNVPNQCLALPMTDIDWDDWGRPERILQCIERYSLDSSLSKSRHGIC